MELFPATLAGTGASVFASGWVTTLSPVKTTDQRVQLLPGSGVPVAASGTPVGPQRDEGIVGGLLP